MAIFEISLVASIALVFFGSGGFLGYYEDPATNTEKRVGVDVYILGIGAFFAWGIVALYCAVGLVTLPIDFIMAYLDRPKPKGSDWARKRRELILKETK